MSNYIKHFKPTVCIFQIIVILSFSNCQSKSENKTIQIDSNTFAVGKLNDSNNYNGIIKFYDAKSNKLIYEGNFENGIENGLYKEFYPNGSLKAIKNYYYGKEYGASSFYDSFGLKILENNFFYDIPAGSIIKYKSGKPLFYDFNSLDNENLFHINYDSATGRKITDLQERYFFYKIYNKAILTDYSSEISTKMECRLYLISPPKYNFRYDLVIVDEKYNVVKLVQGVNKKGLQEIFLLNPIKSNNNEFYALRLIINDSINNGENTMFKILPTPY